MNQSRHSPLNHRRVFGIPVCILMWCLGWCTLFGATTKLQIHGLNGITEEEALGLLGNMIEQVVGRSPSPSRADDAAFLLEHTLRKQGYPEAEVDWSIPPGRNVINLTVRQGPTRFLGTIHITGLPKPLKEEIQPYFKDEPIGLNLIIKDKIPYTPEQIETALLSATNHMHAAGYWKATVTLTQTKIHPQTGLIDIHVDVTPGPLHLLTAPEIKGDIPVNLAPLHQQLKSLNEKPANTQNIMASHTMTQNYLTSQGFSFATVSMDRKETKKYIRLTLTITPGKKYHVEKINIVGLERTDAKFMQKRVNKGLGTLYDPSRMKLTRRKFLATGAFEAMLVDTDPQNDGTIDITLRMKEGRAKGVGVYLGAGSYEGGIFGLSYQDRNFRGKLQNLSISTEYSGLGLLGQASISDPMFLGTDLNFNLRTFILTHKFDGYDKSETGLGAELVWDINNLYSLRFYGGGGLAITSKNGLPTSELGYKRYNLGRLGITQRLDFRDSKISPRKGFYAELLTELGTVHGDTIIPYSKIIFRSTYRLPIGNNQYFLFAGRAGTLLNNDSDNLPIDVRYFLGGADSVRSFPERQMGPTVNGDPVGGEAFWIGSIEYNRKIKGPVYTNIFFDAGSLARYAGDIGSSYISYAAGLGFWLDLPIGPVRAEYGYNLNQRPGEPQGSFHFSIGVNF